MAIHSMEHTEVEKAMVIVENAKFFALNDTGIYILLLSPSLSFAIIFYLPIFFGFLTYMTLKFGHLHSDSKVENPITAVILMCLALIFFCVLQKRELKRFLKEQELINKE